MATLKNTIINDTGFLGLPTGNTAQRPSSPANGYMRFNTSSNTIEYYALGAWSDIGAGNAQNTLNVEYLVVGGGGSGGGSVGGGGGAGGLLAGTSTLQLNTAYTVTVGGGASAPAQQVKGNNGSASVFSTQTATGGGGGAASTSTGGTQSASSGGSGGGGSSYIQAITFRNAQTASTTTTGVSSVTVTKPTGLAVGDLLVAGFIVTNNTTPGTWGSATYPSGFTEGSTVQADVNAWNKTFFAYKIADAADVAASNFTFTYTESGGPYRLAVILASYFNVNQTTPIDVTPTTQNNPTNTSSIVAPSITPANAQPKRLLTFYAISDGNATTDSRSIAPPVGQTERAEVVPGATAFSRLALADEAYESASATGTRTGTITGGDCESMAITILLRSNDAPTGTTGGTGTAGQGNNGGDGNSNPNGNSSGAGGGGASAIGATPSNNNVGGNGGAGVSSSITGSAVTYAGGGGGGAGTTGGTGGAGGGGNGGVGSSAGTAGTANRGGGGGGGYNFSGGTASAGGSGVVILRIADTRTATFSGGITSSLSTVTGFKIYTVTAGTGTVTFT